MRVGARGRGRPEGNTAMTRTTLRQTRSLTMSPTVPPVTRLRASEVRVTAAHASYQMVDVAR